MGNATVRVLLTTVAVVVGLALAACSGSARGLGPAGLPAGYFVAADASTVDMVSASTGQVEHVLAPITRGRMDVKGLALEGQTLYVTYAAQERCTSGVAGCAPAEHSCGAEVDRFDLTTGSRKVVWRVGADVSLANAVPSPDQSRIVAQSAVCGHSYFNEHLVVRDLRSGAEVSLGAQLPRCHSLQDPRWTSNGTQLLVIYAAARPSPAGGVPEGVCSVLGAAGVVTLDPTRENPGLNGVRRAPPPGCGYESLATRAAYVYAVATCGPARKATLQRLDRNLAPRQAWPLGSSSDGSSIAIDTTGDVLVADYQSNRPQTVLDKVTGGRLTQVSTVALGLLIPRQLAW